MHDTRSNDDAQQPAKATSSKRRHWNDRVPPWIEERVAQEARIREHAEAVGFPVPLKPDSKAFARSLGPAQQRLVERLAKQSLESDKTIPF